MTQISFFNQMGAYTKTDLERMDVAEAASGPLDQDWSPPSHFPDSYKQADIISIDLETRDPRLMERGPGWATGDGNIIGFAVAFNDYCGYFPTKHEAGGNMPETAVRSYIQELMETNIPKVMHNATYDLGWLQAEGFTVNGDIHDTMIAAAMLDENRMYYNLNSVARDYIGESKSEKALRRAAEDYGVNPKSEMWRLPSRFVGAYAEQDARITLRLWHVLEAEMQKQEVSSVYTLERSLIRHLVTMRKRGVRVDLEAAERVQDDLAAKEKDLLSSIHDDTNVWVEPWTASSIAKVFDAVGLDYPRTEKTDSPSFTKQYLTSHAHPVAQKIVRLREFNKANTTFVSNIFKFENDGRIHAEFHPLRSDDGGTVTGRFSSSNPNLQQIPARDPVIKAAIRGLFIPEEYCKWGSFDYASQEPRWLAHYCASMPADNRHAMIDDVIEMYQNGDADFHQMVADMAGISRKEAKTVNLGIMYGMGVGKLGAVLGLETAEAKELLAEYHSKVPFVKGIADAVSSAAQRNGHIRTVLGRKCRFEKWEPTQWGVHKPLSLEEARKTYGGSIKRAFTYKALNRLIQGSSADQTKKAMLLCAEEGLLPMLQVHDELCFNLEDEDQIEPIVEIMENCVEAKVPFKVDCAVADNWGQIE